MIGQRDFERRARGSDGLAGESYIAGRDGYRRRTIPTKTDRLRAVRRIVDESQRSCALSQRRWRESYTDFAAGPPRNTVTAGIARDCEVPGRCDTRKSKGCFLPIGKRDGFRRAGIAGINGSKNEAAGRECDRIDTGAAEAYCLRTGGGIIGHRQRSGSIARG